MLDQGRKEAYWTDPTELFARVFEVWVTDKLKASGSINEFLVYGPDEPPSSWHTKVNSYPEDQERLRIVHYLDRWLSELVTTWKFEKREKSLSLELCRKVPNNIYYHDLTFVRKNVIFSNNLCLKTL
ncbi:LPD1 domain-containing protein (plasmid) [Acinetobacter baumannii]|nr:LPD1 domain-containing protein [Acinetobacter baumannii]